MAGINISIVLLDTPDQIEKKILKAIAEEFNSLMRQKITNIRGRVRSVTIDYIKTTETYNSLIDGDLAAHFGLPYASRQSMIDAIIEQIGNSIEIIVKPVKASGKKFQGGTTINILVKNFSDILSMAEASIPTENGLVLPWLEWLLIRGDRLIISEHEIHLIRGKGRSDMAIMVKNAAGSWRVPSQYSGTIKDNWLTRALKVNQDRYLDTITNILKQELQ